MTGCAVGYAPRRDTTPTRLPGRSTPSACTAPTRSDPDSSGYDAGKKTGGRKRFTVTDTLGLLLTVLVCAASVPDRQGGRRTLLGLYLDQVGQTRRTRYLLADGGFAGQLVDWAHRLLRITVEIVRKPAGQRGFTVIPAGGSWSGPSPGSPPTVGWPAPTSGSPPTLKRRSTGR